MSTRQIQQKLKDLGYYKGTVDGSYGPLTKQAVRAFQKDKGLVVDGNAGPKTQAALGGGGASSGGGNSQQATDLAQQYGFSMALLETDPELKNLFNQAVAGTWTPERFTAAVRNTNWYKKHGESYRQAEVLRTSDPATYKQSVAQSKSRLQQFAASMGAVLTGSTLDALAEQAFQLGWDDNQLREHLSTYVKWTDGRMLGQAGVYATQLKDYARDMGLKITDGWIQNQISTVMGGRQTIDDVQAKLREQAVSAYPHLAERLRAGETVADVANPYRQSMAALLEVDADSIGLDEGLMKGALQQRTADGKGFQMQTLAEFEDTVRKDKRWAYTNNANDAAASMANDLLRSFGVIA